jgi:MFS transporter, ACS family, tartrate transporter
MDGVLGLKGWQWVFIVEALPAVVLAVVVWKVMADRPAVADWLAPDERQWLEMRLEEERRTIDRRGRLSLLEALSDRRVLALSARSGHSEKAEAVIERGRWNRMSGHRRLF